MLRTELHTVLDRSLLDDILALIEDTTRVDGHRPVGEHKYAHLAVGATGWAGAFAYDSDRLVGYAHTRWSPPGARPRVAVEVVVHPHADPETVAPRLLAEVRALLARAGGGLLWLWVHRVEDPGATLAARLGLEVQRQLAFMTLPMPQRPVPAAMPEGATLLPFNEATDEEAFLTVNNAAFEGHPENGGWDRAEFRRRRERDWFDSDGLLLAWRGADLLGFHWTKWHGHDSDEVVAHEPVGEVYVLAVHPDAQGIGLGRALLDAGLAYLWDRRCRRAVLYVDCASTPALRLYRSAGFTLEYQEVCYQEWIDPLDEDRADDLARPA